MTTRKHILKFIQKQSGDSANVIIEQEVKDAPPPSIFDVDPISVNFGLMSGVQKVHVGSRNGETPQIWSITNSDSIPNWLEVSAGDKSGGNNEITLSYSGYDLNKLRLRFPTIYVNGDRDIECRVPIRYELLDDKGVAIPCNVKCLGIDTDHLPSIVSDVSISDINNDSSNELATYRVGYDKELIFKLKHNLENSTPWNGIQVKVPLMFEVLIDDQRINHTFNVTVQQERASGYGRILSSTERIYIDLRTLGNEWLKCEGIRSGYWARTYKFISYGDVPKMYLYSADFQSTGLRKILEVELNDVPIDDIPKGMVLCSLDSINKWGMNYDFNTLPDNASAKELRVKYMEYAGVMLVKPRFCGTELHMFVGLYWNDNGLSELKKKYDAIRVYKETNYYFTNGWDRGNYPINNDDCKYAFDKYIDENPTSPTYLSAEEVANSEKDRK